MTDVKLPSNGNIRFWFVPENGFVNWEAPTADEINAGVDFSDAVSWNDLDFGIQASSGGGSDPAVTAKGAVESRGADAYGGSISLYYPAEYDDDTSIYSQAEQLFARPGVVGYIVERIDGEELRTPTGTTSNPGLDAAKGDLVHIAKVVSDAQGDAVTGEEAFRYTPNFVSQGELAPYTVVTDGTAPLVVVSPAAATVTNGHTLLTATVNGRSYTRGVKWRSDDTTKATVSENGVVTAIEGATGTVNITATYPATNTTSTAAVVTL